MTPERNTPTAPKASETQTLPESAAVDTAHEKKTTGEKWFHNITYWLMNFVGTFVLSGALGYLLKYSDKNVPFTQTSYKDGWSNLVDKMGSKTVAGKPIGKNTANDVLMTTALMMGGNVMLIPIKAMEKRKKSVVQYFNRKYGTPEEVEAYEKKHEDAPKQSWGSLIKGRIVAWLVVFGSFTVAGKFFGDKMEKFQDWVGTKTCKATGKPVEGDKDGKSATYRVGEMFGLDTFATAAAVLLLDVSSHAFMKKSAAKKSKTDNAPVETPQERPLTKDELEQDYQTVKSWAKDDQRKEKPTARDTSHAKNRNIEKTAAEAEQTLVAV